MFTISILVNTQPVYTRSCRNTMKEREGKTVYLTDTGEEVLHDPGEGAVVLAKKLLDTVKDV